jgi:hypothetical protein
MKTLSLKLPDEIDARLTALARRRGASKSEIVRGALEVYLESGGAPAKGSVLDLAGPLVGSLEGPRDLSCRKEYLEGYGT